MLGKIVYTESGGKVLGSVAASSASTPDQGAVAETEPFSSSLHDCPAALSFKTSKSLLNNCLHGRAWPLRHFLDAGSSLLLLLFTLPFMQCQHCCWFICYITRACFKTPVFHENNSHWFIWAVVDKAVRDRNGHTTGFRSQACIANCSVKYLWKSCPRTGRFGGRRTGPANAVSSSLHPEYLE